MAGNVDGTVRVEMERSILTMREELVMLGHEETMMGAEDASVTLEPDSRTRSPQEKGQTRRWIRDAGRTLSEKTKMRWGV